MDRTTTQTAQKVAQNLNNMTGAFNELITAALLILVILIVILFYYGVKKSRTDSEERSMP